MKLTVGVLAVLLLTAAAAMAQPLNPPFPLAASPAVQSDEGLVPLVVAPDYETTPPSMASDMAAPETIDVLAWQPNEETGSQFPIAASPAIQEDKSIVPLVNEGYSYNAPSSMATDEGEVSTGAASGVLDWHPRVETGSNFPTGANPGFEESRNHDYDRD